MKQINLELLESKIQLAEEYVKEVGEPIRATTVYKGVNIGTWRQNLRASEKRDELNIPK